MKRLFLLSTVMLLQSLSLFSQKTETYEVNFRVYGLRPGDYSNLVAVDHRLKPIEIQFENKERSARYEATLSKTHPWLNFYRKPLAPAEERIPIARIRLGSGKSDFLLIFGKLGMAEEAYDFHVSAINDDRRNFPAGSICIINFSGRKLYGKANKATFELEHLASSKPASGANDENTSIAIVVEGANRYHLAYNNTVKLRKSDRAILILRQPVRRGSLRLGGHIIRDNPAEAGEGSD